MPDGAINRTLETGVTADETDAVSAEQAAVDMLDKIADDAEYERRHALVSQIYAGSELLWQSRVRRLIRNRNHAGAVAMIDEHDFGDDVERFAVLVKADLLYSAKELDRAFELYLALIEDFPQRREVRANFAKKLLADGLLARAHDLVGTSDDMFGDGPKARALRDRVIGLHETLTRLEGRAIDLDEDARILAMKHAILGFRDRRVPKPKAPGIGRLALITGSLGPGGAERQLTRLAIELERARKHSGAMAGHAIPRPVEIIVRSHGPEKQNDFFLDGVQAAGVELTQLNLIQPQSDRQLAIADPMLKLLLTFMPSTVNFGVRRLTQHLRETKTDVASAWQDGACLFVGLAALIAGVPQIQLAIRGLPPSMRRHMFRPEYEVLYRAMAEIPGVTFLSNNHAAAKAYADWLDVPMERFSIVYNGVEPMQPVGSDECQKMWDDFAARTADATHTIGGVFRFDTDKQPDMWIRFARRYLKRHPDARIVLVGGGRLLDKARRLAAELGIADRILFTDRSSRVGYWMSHMQVMLLLSRYEGLPNVLIEAQYMGVRVVTTPAGGAAECLIDGVTGHVLECVEKPDLDNIVAKTHQLVLQSDDVELLGDHGAGRRFLDEHFSIQTMLASYVEATVGPDHASTGAAVREAA